MALTTTNAQISAQDGAGAVTNFTSGANIPFTPGTLLTLALQSTTGVAKANYKFEAAAYPSLHQRIIPWQQGQPNLIQVVMPAYQAPVGGPLSGIQLIVEVDDGVQSIAQATYFLTSTNGINTGTQHVVRAVALSALQAYTNVGGVLTENTNGALATQDGVTLAVGDLILVPAGTPLSNGSNADAGIYVVTSLGGASAKWILTSAPEWPQGAIVLPKTEVLVSAGTVYADTTWVVTNTGRTNAIGSTSFTFFPRQVTQSLTLVAGTVTIANVPLISATTSIALAERTTANTSTATTGGYNTIGGKTAGALGTATFNFQACVAAGTINNADVSTLAVTVINPC